MIHICGVSMPRTVFMSTRHKILPENWFMLLLKCARDPSKDPDFWVIAEGLLDMYDYNWCYEARFGD